MNTTNRKQTRPQRVPSPFHTNVKCSKKDRKVKDTRNTNTQAQRQEYAKYMRVCEVVCMDLPLLTNRLKGRRSEKKYLYLFLHLYYGGSDVFVFEFERLLLLTIRLKGRKSKGVRSKELMGVLLGGGRRGEF